tara:strand:+ start:379 stop:1188 length:810 start_codon:yes stop_codon:yes gene_type:complete
LEYFIKIKQRLKSLLGFDVQGKYLKIQKSDVFITEYPKSGITWISFIVANLISDREISFSNFRSFVYPIYSLDKSYLDSIAGKRYFKSHEPYQPSYPKVLYLLRDPRDVSISYYNWFKKYRIDFNDSFDEFLLDFLTGGVSNYGSYKNHVTDWIENSKDNKKFMCIRYEDVIRDSYCEVKKIAIFLEISISDEKILDAIKLSSFSNMQKLEHKETNSTFFDKSNNKLRFVRKGKVNAWKTELTEGQKELFKKHLGQFLIDYNYEQNLDW